MNSLERNNHHNSIEPRGAPHQLQFIYNTVWIVVARDSLKEHHKLAQIYAKAQFSIFRLVMSASSRKIHQTLLGLDAISPPDSDTWNVSLQYFSSLFNRYFCFNKFDIDL